jgi:hypothetical protein
MHEIDISFYPAAIIINRDAHRLHFDTQDELLDGVGEELYARITSRHQTADNMNDLTRVSKLFGPLINYCVDFLWWTTRILNERRESKIWSVVTAPITFKN